MKEDLKKCCDCYFLYKFNNKSGRYMCNLSEDKKDIVKKVEGKKRYVINEQDIICCCFKSKY